MRRDLNLLFGVFAVQLRKVSPVDLMAAAAAWATDPSRELPERLLEVGALTRRDLDFIQKLVDEAVNAHGGDAAATMQSIGGEAQVYASFGNSIILDNAGGVPTVKAQPHFDEVVHYLGVEEVPGVQETPGRYTHVSEYGRGGMGRVLLVHDAFLRRDVALKELLPGPVPKDPDNPSTPVRKYMGFLARFLQEARITGQLEHPAIVPVYELGHRQDGTLYYTMKLVRGKTLRQAIREHTTLQDRLRLLAHFVDLCNAIAYAHSRGIIHRDLKPDNVMVGEFGETVVLDWGLAKAKDREDVHADGLAETIRLLNLGNIDSAAKTQYGQVMGTPAYMPPEQAKGQLDQVDERSDIYSLGAVLYEILSGQPPFAGAHVQDILRKVIQDIPKPVRQHDPDIPAELAAICARSMVKAPDQRYASARELADEVQRFQSGALVRSYRYRFRDYLTFYWRRYKPLVVTGAAAFIAVNVLGALYVHNLYVSVQTERELRAQAEAAQKNEAAARNSAEHEGYYSDILLANELIKSSDYVGAQAALWKTPEHLRGWEWGFLLRECNADYITLQGAKGGVLSASLNPDGSRICLGLVRGGAVVLDPRTGETLLHLKSDWTEMTSARFSPDGSSLLITGSDRGPFLIDTKTGDSLQALSSIRNSGAINGVFTPDGSRIVVRSTRIQGQVCVIDARTGAQIAEFDITKDLLNSIGINPAADEFIASSESGIVFVGDLRTGKTAMQLNNDDEPVMDAQFSPNGDRIACASTKGIVRIWDRASGAKLQTVKPHESTIYSVAFDPTGDHVVTAAGDRTAAIVHAVSGKILATLRGHSNSILSAQFDASGNQILTASMDGSARIWNVNRAREKNEIVAVGPRLLNATLSPDMKRVLVVNEYKEHCHPFIQIFDTATAQEVAAFGGFAEEIMMANYNTDGTRIVAATLNKASYILDSTTGQVLTELLGHRDIVRDVEFSRDGLLVASASGDKTAAVWNAASGEMVQTFKGHEAIVRHARFDSSAAHLLTASDDGTARVWNVHSGDQLAVVKPASSGVLAAVFDPSDESCWLAGADSRIYRWNWKGNTVVHEITAHSGSVINLSINPDGTRLASSGVDASVRLFELPTGRELISFNESVGGISSVNWSTDGTSLVATTTGNRAQLRKADPWQQHLLSDNHGATWRLQYDSFKKSNGALPPPVTGTAPAIPHRLTIPESSARTRLSRLAAIVKSDDQVQSRQETSTGIVINDAIFAITKRFGLLRDDVITEIDQIPLDTPQSASSILQTVLSKPLESVSMRVIRDYHQRDVLVQIRPVTRYTEHARLPKLFVSVVINELDRLRQNVEMFERDQRKCAGWMDIPLDRDGIDGLWVIPVAEELTDSTEVKWASVMNQFFSTVNLYPNDHILSVNGVPLTSIDVVLDCIGAAEPALLANQPYTYTLLVERTPFELVELHIVVE